SLALKEYSEKEKSPYTDQFHALIDLWGKNKPNETMGAALTTIRNLATQKDLEGAEHLREFLKVHDKNGKAFVSMLGDPVHPGAPGQLMMAAALLKELGAEGFVSSVTFDAKAGKVAEAKGCAIDEVKTESGKIAFTRLDESVAFPIAEAARPVVAFYPAI